METPIEIDFHELDVSPSIQKMLEDHVRKLESRYGRIPSQSFAVCPTQRGRFAGWERPPQRLYQELMQMLLATGTRLLRS